MLLLGIRIKEVLRRECVWFIWCIYGCRGYRGRNEILRKSCWWSCYFKVGSVVVVLVSDEFGMYLWFECLSMLYFYVLLIF